MTDIATPTVHPSALLEIVQAAIEETLSRFWEKVARDEAGCWRWTGSHKPNGYGEFRVTRTNRVYAHRWAFLIAHGPIPAGYDVCHTCDVRDCVNPDHLFAGTRSENMIDASLKGRIVNHLGPAPKRMTA